MATKQQIKDSLAHWNRLATGTTVQSEGIGPIDCAFCLHHCNVRWNCELYIYLQTKEDAIIQLSIERY